MKVSDYIADTLVKNGINTVFTVVGGGAMHLNDSLGHHSELHSIYQHHEQACSMAADGYARTKNRMAAVCVTSGPGAINAMNGVAGAYQDSIPMLVLSGQVKSTLTVKRSRLNLRTLGGQEFDIVSAVQNMTKYAVMVEDKNDIKYILEKAIYLAKSGRPGPTWVDIPVDVQGSLINPDDLKAFNACDDEDTCLEADNQLSKEELKDKVALTIERLFKAERPVFYAGNGIRLSGAVNSYQALIEMLNIPVVTCWDSIDLIETDHPLYVGRGGIMGDRAGNFAVQNSDFVLAVGNRLSIYQVGYDISTWAREAFVVDVDIDPNELKKPTIRVDLPICSDAGRFINELIKQWNSTNNARIRTEWIERCQNWKSSYPVVLERHYKNSDRVNVYAFIDSLSRMLKSGDITVVSNGSASVVGSQTYNIGKNQRFIMNCALSSMGYGLPSSIGVCIANGCDPVVCIEGDGSIQMNIQELQTIVTNRLPIKIFVINNGGYHQIRLTQKNMFKNALVGVGPESGDLEFPDFEKIADAYGISYKRICSNGELQPVITGVLRSKTAVFCEVFCTMDQIFEPKSSAKRLDDGTIVSPPLEDMAPFLPREELESNMIVK